MANVRHYRFRAINPINITKVGVAKYKVRVANLNVGGAADPPTTSMLVEQPTHDRKLHPW